MAQPPKVRNDPSAARAEAAAESLSSLAREALAFFHPRMGLPSFTPKAVVDEIVAAGLLRRAGGGRLVEGTSLARRAVFFAGRAHRHRKP